MTFSDTLQTPRLLQKRSRVLSSVALLPFSLLMVSCSSLLIPHGAPMSVENARDSITVPANWSSPAQEGLPNTDWVARFTDPQLSEYVGEALERNTDILSALEAIEASRAGLKISRADRFINLRGSANITRTERAFDPFATGPNGVDSDTTSLSAGLSGSWEPDFWGRIRNQILISEFDVAASEADLAAARLSIAALVAQAYFNVVEAKQLVDLSYDDVATQERSLTLTKRRYESGITGRSDLSLALSQLSQAKALRVLRMQSLAEIQRQLEVFLRRYPNAQIQTADSLPQLARFEGAGDPAGIFLRRPDLRAQEARLTAQGLQVDLARKALLPQITLGADVDAVGTGLRSLFDINALIASLASTVTAPLFEGGRLRGNVALQEARTRQLLESYAGTTLRAFQDVENALAAEDTLMEREAALQDALSEARIAENRLERRYAEGLATILELLDAQSRRLSSQAQLINAQRERLTNRVRLHVALGGTPLATDELLVDAALSELLSQNLIVEMDLPLSLAEAPSDDATTIGEPIADQAEAAASPSNGGWAEKTVRRIWALPQRFWTVLTASSD